MATISVSSRRTAVGIAVIAFLSGTLSAQSIVRTVSLSHPPQGGDIAGVWSGNSLLGIEAYESGAPILYVQDEAGVEIERVAVQVPGAHLLQVISGRFAKSGDGYLAVTGIAWDGNGKLAHFLNVISPDAASQTVVRTTPYDPRAVTFAADGTIWTAGLEVNSAGVYKGDEEGYFVIRRFDKTGKFLGGAIPRTLFPGHLGPVEGSRLVASKDRVGWFSPTSSRYTEFSLDGKALGTYPLPFTLSDLVGVALCDDGNAWVSSGYSMSALMMLDRAHGTWVGGKPQGFVALLGCTDTTLVTFSHSSELEWRATHQ